MEKTLDIDTTGWTEYSCDKCGSCSSYSPDHEITGCFGCLCKYYDELKVECQCGWKGGFRDYANDDLIKRNCPECGMLGEYIRYEDRGLLRGEGE